VAPNGSYLIEDVHRAGGVPAILGELRRAGLLHENVHAIHARSLAEWLDRWDVRAAAPAAEAVELFHAAPGGRRSAEAFSQSERWETLDLDPERGCIRDAAHAYSADGGLAILKGNLSEDGCVVKTAGVDASILTFTGAAVVLESQEEAIDAILNKRVQAGDVVIIRYEGPRGGPGM
jgi:dihydroxy-acid dehydratase